MPKQISIEEILKTNPEIDKSVLTESEKLGEELKKLGLIRRGYRLGPPARVRRDQDHDPRLTHLKHRHH